mmetsp:Transcript_47785/g.93328  ORF Transcript_47785/g.93328 Transcript_47785/m.93328 type:complete len:254 (-) Transcript_47785:140-901(-)
MASVRAANSRLSSLAAEWSVLLPLSLSLPLSMLSSPELALSNVISSGAAGDTGDDGPAGAPSSGRNLTLLALFVALGRSAVSFARSSRRGVPVETLPFFLAGLPGVGTPADWASGSGVCAEGFGGPATPRDLRRRFRPRSPRLPSPGSSASAVTPSESPRGARAEEEERRRRFLRPERSIMPEPVRGVPGAWDDGVVVVGSWAAVVFVAAPVAVAEGAAFSGGTPGGGAGLDSDAGPSMVRNGGHEGTEQAGV